MDGMIQTLEDKYMKDLVRRKVEEITRTVDHAILGGLHHDIKMIIGQLLIDEGRLLRNQGRDESKAQQKGKDCPKEG